MEDMEEQDMAVAAAGEEVAAPEGGVKAPEGVGDGDEDGDGEGEGEGEGEVVVKSVPNEELNSKIAHDVVSEVEPGEVDDSVVAVAGSVDGSLEAPGSVGGETAPSVDVVDATEKVESWDLSEAVAKNVQEDSKPKFSEEGSDEGVDAEDAPVVSIDSIEDSAGEKPVAALPSDDVEGDSEHAEGVSEIAGGEGSSREIPGEGSVEKVESEAVDAPVEEVHEAVEATTSAEPKEEPASLEVVPLPSDDVEEKPVEVNSRDISEVASISTSQSAENEDVSAELPLEGPSDNVDGEALDASVDSEGLVPGVDDKVVEPTSIAKADEGSLEPDSVLAPADNIEEKSTEVNSEETSEANAALSSEESAENKDVSPELPAERPSDNVNGETLEPPVDGKELEPVVDDTIVEPTTSAKADEESAEPAEPEPVSAPADEVEEKSIKVNSEDTSEANAVLPSEESAENKDTSPEFPAEGPSDKVDSETVEAPVDSKGLEPEVDDKVVEPSSIAEADEGSAEPAELQSVSIPADDVEEKSVEVDSEDTSEANAVLPSEESAENKDISPVVPAEGSSDNVDGEALEAPIDSEGPDAQVVHEVVEPTTSAEVAEGSLESEPVSSPADNVEEKSIEVNSEDTSEINAVLPIESAENKDVSPELEPAEGSVDKVDGDALEAPIDSEGPDAKVVHEVVEPTTSAEADEGSLDSEPVLAAADNVEDKFVEVKSEDTSEANTELPLESVEIKNVNPEQPAEGPSDSVDSEELAAPVDSEGLDAQVVHEVVEPTTNAEAYEGSAEPESVSAAVDVEDKTVEVKSKDTSEANTELPLESAENKDVNPEHPVEGPSANVNGEALEAPVDSEESDSQVVHEVVEPTTSAEAYEGSAEPESVSAAVDVEDKSVEVKSEDTSEANTELPLEGAENKDVNLEQPAEGPSDSVDSEELAAPVDSEGLDAQVVHEVVEPTTSAEAYEGSAEPESVSAAVDVEDKTVEVNSEDTSEANTELPLESAENKDVNPEHPVEGPSANVDGEALEAPVDSEESDSQVVHEVVESATSAEVDEGSLAPEPVSAPADDVEEKSIEVNSEDTSETNAVLPTESTGNQDVNPDLEPAEGSVDKASKEVTLYAPVEEVHEVVEANNIEPREESTEPESVSLTPDDVEDKSLEVSEATTALASADNEVVTSEPPAEESADNVSSAALEPEAVDEVVEPATSAEPVEESAEPESVSALDHVEDRSVQVASEDTSEAATVLPSESADSKVSSELPADEIDEIGESEDVPTEAKHDEESPEPESTPDATEDKSVDVDSGDVTQAITEPETANNEVVSSQLSTEESADNVSSDALNAQAPYEVMEATTSEEPVKESSEPEFVSAPSDNVEDKSVDVNSEDVTEVITASESADNEDVRPKPSIEEPSENLGNEVTLYAPAEEVHEVLEATIHSEPKEDSAEMESVPEASDDMEDDFVMVNSKDVAEASTELESADNKIVNRELPAEESADNVSSGALKHEAVHEAVEPATSAEPVEESAEPKSVSALDHVEDKFVEVNSEDMSEAVTVLPSGGSGNELVSRELPAEGTADNVSSGALKYEAVHEAVEPAISAQPVKESAESKSVSALDHVEDKFTEVNSEDTGEAVTVLPSGGSGNELVSRELPAEGTADNVSSGALKYEAVHEAVEPATSAEPVEESAEPKSVSALDHVEDKFTEVNSEDTGEAVTVLPSGGSGNELVSRELPAEGTADNVSSGALKYEAVDEAVEPATSAEPVEESAEPKSVSALDHVEDKFTEVNSEDTGEAVTVLPSGGSGNELVSRELPAEGTADNVSSGALKYEAVDEAVEPATSAEPVEESAEPKSVSALDHVEDKFTEVNSEDTGEAVTVLPSGGSGNELVSRELPAEGTAENVTSETIEPEAAHEVVEPTTSAEADEGSTEPKSLSAADDVEGKSVEVSSEDTGDAVTVLPSGGAENELVSRELLAEGSSDKVNASVEEIGKIEDAATNAKPDESSASLDPVAAPDDDQTMSEEVEPEVSAPEMEESIMATSTPLPAEEEHEQSEVSHEGSRGNEDDSIRVDTVSVTKENDTAEHTSKELLAGADSGDAPNNPQGLSSEEPSDLSLENHKKSLSAENGVALVDRCIQMEELPQHIAAESQRSVSADPEVNAGNEERISEGGDTVKEQGSETQPVSTNGNLSVEDASHMLKTEMTDDEAVLVATQPVKDVSHMLQTGTTDKEVKLAAAHHLENNVAPEESVEDETPALESESSHGEPLIPPAESSGASQANEVETVSREVSGAPTTSGVVRESNDESHDAGASEQMTPYLATALALASGEKGNSSVAATSDTSPLEISNPPPVVKDETAPKSYNLDEVAHNLHDAAEMTLEDVKSSNIEDGQTSVAQSVAQIVLDESSKTGDSLEYISGVVQDVAQLAQNAAQSDPNILPDTVARVFDGATGASPTNEASPAKETTSLRTMFSLFIVWCVSLCASRISSKDMPAPALKLAAEEVTAVLHSNTPSQPAPSHEAASSNH